MKKLITMVVILAMMSTTVFAVNPAPDAVISGGTLEVTDLIIADFTPVTLDGTTQTTAAVVSDTTLTDSTGTGAGWNISLTASAFTNVGLDVLSLGSLELGTVSIAVQEIGSTDITNIVISQGNIDTVSGVNILSAPLDEGMGTYTVSMTPMTLTLLPKEAMAGTYTSTVTVALVSGP